MIRIEKIPYKVGFGWRLLKSYTSRFLTLVGIAFLWLAAPLQAQFAYVVNYGSSNVSAYRIGANGVLRPVPGSPFETGLNPQSVAVDPTGKFAYVANGFANNISAYRIGANGALTPVPRVALRSGELRPLGGRGSNGQVRLRVKCVPP